MDLLFVPLVYIEAWLHKHFGPEDNGENSLLVGIWCSLIHIASWVILCLAMYLGYSLVTHGYHNFANGLIEKDDLYAMGFAVFFIWLWWKH